MNKILVAGAGRSSNAIIQYLLDKSTQNQWRITIADFDYELARTKTFGHPNANAIQFNVHDVDYRRSVLGEHDIAVSLLPSHMHLDLAKDCVSLGKHLITASYVSPQMKILAEMANKKGLIFMGELGLDPGLDHMSAMKKIDELKSEGAVIRSFKSYTGGLISDVSDNNPWHYKFSWNPRNVVMAGKGTAQYLEKGRFKYIPYHHLFKRYELVEIKGMGPFEMYANRDSLLYRAKYGLEDIPTLLRGTLRRVGFCDAWNAFVQLGLTDDSFPIVDSASLTYRELVNAFLPEEGDNDIENKFARAMNLDPEGKIMSQLKWTGIFENNPISLSEATPAQILENLLLDKWKLEEKDKDLIVMQHKFEYEINGTLKRDYCTLSMIGNDSTDTAMSRLVGLPMGMFVELVMQGRVVPSGNTHIPTESSVYLPILKQLAEYGVQFSDYTEEL